MKPEQIHPAIRILKKEAARLAVPVVGQYSREPFKTLISCLLSLRTQDKTTDEASARLFARASEPRAMLALPEPELRRLIYPVSFYKTKAVRIRQICELLLSNFGGEVPNEIDALLTLPGVGRKTANLVVTLSFNKPGICVDTHVHRICNRWGYVRTKSADETEAALRAKLPRRYWIILNDLLVPYGQYVCRPLSPWCSLCKLKPYCGQVDVGRTR